MKLGERGSRQHRLVSASAQSLPPKKKHVLCGPVTNVSSTIRLCRNESVATCLSPCCRLNSVSRYAENRTFGQELSLLLDNIRLSQYALSKLTGLGPDTICKLVHDTRRPTEVQALRICLALTLSPRLANRLLEAANFYPISEPQRRTAPGTKAPIGNRSITRPADGR